MSDWYDELRRKDRRAHERLGLPEFDTAPIGKSDGEAPQDAASRYLRAMGEKRTHDTGRNVRWSCGCLTERVDPQRLEMSETILRACAKHAGKIA